MMPEAKTAELEEQQMLQVALYVLNMPRLSRQKKIPRTTYSR